MASKTTFNNDEPLASIDFPGPYAATFYFNNDLAEEPDYLLSSDGGYLTDESDTSEEEEELPPESYMSEFPVVEDNPWPALSPSSTPSLTSSMQTQISSSDLEHSPKDQTDTSELSFTHVGSASSEIEVNTDGYVPFVEPSEGVVDDRTNQTFGASKAQSTTEKRSPAHFINFVDWKNPVPFEDFAKLSPQHRSEIRAIHWDSRLWFSTMFERGTPKYYQELARWRAARLRNIAGVPMDQKQADEIGYIMFRVSEIAAARERERRRRERQAAGPK
ncbi:uncharacterized protein NECHADRAFT_78676 [Fusarium vanettenii 77-13-4]|uniref:Uncharacterized protein n=1 Tax=Fusarium vanettenii (strain ATCC MYA-4622 / CBS 123669 / FGSC 9596 / NRRL 45880 / 77-13-4) TaxID=660122 RepID=C7YP90_FUSV7|nr:uncharacterized protein NECHADRAFT_78676 [Fusarium vanettenii 77-13-4]EEU46256.1 predicted protein [Fusarium vanettenii 77-13-4]